MAITIRLRGAGPVQDVVDFQNCRFKLRGSLIRSNTVVLDNNVKGLNSHWTQWAPYENRLFLESTTRAAYHIKSGSAYISQDQPYNIDFSPFDPNKHPTPNIAPYFRNETSPDPASPLVTIQETIGRQTPHFSQTISVWGQFWKSQSQPDDHLVQPLAFGMQSVEQNKVGTRTQTEYLDEASGKPAIQRSFQIGAAILAHYNLGPREILELVRADLSSLPIKYGQVVTKDDQEEKKYSNGQLHEESSRVGAQIPTTALLQRTIDDLTGTETSLSVSLSIHNSRRPYLLIELQDGIYTFTSNQDVMIGSGYLLFSRLNEIFENPHP